MIANERHLFDIYKYILGTCSLCLRVVVSFMLSLLLSECNQPVHARSKAARLLCSLPIGRERLWLQSTDATNRLGLFRR